MMEIKVSCPFLEAIYYDNGAKSYPKCKKKGYRLTDSDNCAGCDLRELSYSKIKKVHASQEKKSGKSATENAKLSFGQNKKLIGSDR